jgi:hypothetical protein
MTKIRKSLIAVLVTSIVATTTVASFDSAKAGMLTAAGGGKMFNGHHGNGGMGHRGHRGSGNFGTGMAIGLGLSLLTTAIVASQANAHQRIHRDAKRKGWTAVNQRRHDCHLVREWKKLVQSAEEALARDIRMNQQYPQYHSVEHVTFAKQELERRREELKRARARCA